MPTLNSVNKETFCCTLLLILMAVFLDNSGDKIWKSVRIWSWERRNCPRQKLITLNSGLMVRIKLRNGMKPRTRNKRQKKKSSILSNETTFKISFILHFPVTCGDALSSRKISTRKYWRSSSRLRPRLKMDSGWGFRARKMIWEKSNKESGRTTWNTSRATTRVWMLNIKVLRRLRWLTWLTFIAFRGLTQSMKNWWEFVLRSFLKVWVKARCRDFRSVKS